jgi:NDP-sugar pyrophosphorylase family protein
MKAVILAGGLGTRLRPFTEVIPKPLLPLGEKSLMEVQIHALRDHGFTEIFVATNYKSDYVEAFFGDGSKHGVKLRYSREEKPLGTCGPLSLLKNELMEPFVMVNGDILTKLNYRNFYDFCCGRNSTLTVATKVVVTPFRFGNVTADSEDFIVGLEEKPDLALEVLAGIYGMTPGIFEFVPDGEYFGMDALIRNMLAGGHKISRYLVHEYWIDIGQIDDYSQAKTIYAQNF